MSSNSNSNYSPRPDWRTERNLLQNFNQVSNKKLKTISLANALKQMKMKNDRSKKVRKQLKFNSNSNSKTKETNTKEKSKSKTKNSKPKK
jgi:hypothetical protein